MTPDAVAADTGFLTIEQAVAALDAKDNEGNEAPAETEQPAEEQNTEAEPAAEDASEPETATEGDNAETEEGEAEGEEPELPAVEPPRFWDADAKKRFGELPRDLQELVLAKEKEHDRATASKLEEAANVRKTADEMASKFGQYVAKLDKLVPQAEQTFASRWGEGEIDWNRVAREQGVETAFALKNQHDSEKSALESLQKAQQEAAVERTKAFIADRNARLATTCPDLADPKNGPDRQLALVKFWSSLGRDANRLINQADDVELSLLYDAMRFRSAQADAKAKAANPPKQAPKPAAQPRPTVRPTAAPARAGSPQQQRLQQLERKGRLTMDETVELLDLREANNR